jgi:hypothetical protein
MYFSRSGVGKLIGVVNSNCPIRAARELDTISNERATHCTGFGMDKLGEGFLCGANNSNQRFFRVSNSDLFVFLILTKIQNPSVDFHQRTQQTKISRDYMRQDENLMS